LTTTNYVLKANGTTLGNSLIWDNGTNVGIGNTNTSYTLDVSGTGRFTSRLNVNAASGFAELYVKGASSTTGMYLFDNNTESGLWKVDSGYMAFATTNVERMRITSAGNVGIGTSTPSAALQVSAIPSTNGDSVYQIVTFDTNTATSRVGAGISFGGYYNGTTDTTTAFASIKGFKENLTNNDYAGALAFMTRVNGGNSTERMRITSGGGVYIGLTSSGTNVFAVSYNAVVSSLYVTNAGSIGSYTFGTGPVYANAGLLTMTNPSDSRLKDNINNISWGLSDILKLRPVSYHWKDDKINQGVQFGFIAQEVQDVMPEAIKEFGEDIIYLGLEKDAIYVTLVKAIQEQNQMIQELNERLNKAGL
jgi:hypothetical protein